MCTIRAYARHRVRQTRTCDIQLPYVTYHKHREAVLRKRGVNAAHDHTDGTLQEKTQSEGFTTAELVDSERAADTAGQVKGVQKDVPCGSYDKRLAGRSLVNDHG